MATCSVYATLACGASTGTVPRGTSTGAIAVPALNSSRAALTSQCANACVRPDSGTLMGSPTPRIAARTSTSTHTASCSQASQTMTDRIRRIEITSS